MGSDIVLELDHGKSNPRNSEGAFVRLNDGRLMFAYTRFCGDSGSDYAPAEIRARFSRDHGLTWTKRDKLILANEGKCNVMSVSLLRLQDGRLALFYLRKNRLTDCRPYMRASLDDGVTWDNPVCCVPIPGYYVVNNDRVIQLKTGRLVVPTSLHRVRVPKGKRTLRTHDTRGVLMVQYSDDGGQTWCEADDWWALPVRSRSGIQEPGVVELQNGTLYGWCRTSTGRQWQFLSHDGGNMWTAPTPSRFRAPCSPMSIKRIPATGDLLAVWNDTSGRWNVPSKTLKDGRADDSSWGRTPLATAISSNEGKTWRKAKLVEKDPRRGFCYIAIHPNDDTVLLAYCCGGIKSSVLQNTCIRRVTLDWLYK